MPTMRRYCLPRYSRGFKLERRLGRRILEIVSKE
jgi:hypothetical protein